MVRQSGTIALALAFAWLLVLAEARGAERGFGAAEAQACEQVESVAASAEACRQPAAARDALAAPSVADGSGQVALRRCLSGIQLLI